MPKPQIFSCDAGGLRVADVIPRNLTIYELTDKTCKWPFGDAPPYAYCGCETWTGSPYCEPHASLAQGRGTESERRAHRMAA